MRAYLLSVTILFLLACHKETDDKRDFTPADRDFMITASYANRARVALGVWAITNGSTESVRAFGQTMALTYQQSQNELYMLADSLRYTLPKQPDAAHLAFATKLSSLSGRKFDSTYIANELIDLEAMIDVFEEKSSAEGDQQVKDYAAKYIPHMKNHLQGAELLIP